MSQHIVSFLLMYENYIVQYILKDLEGHTFKKCVITKEFFQHFQCWVSSICYCSILLQSTVSLLNLLKKKNI